jgi:hypothetical protein
MAVGHAGRVLLQPDKARIDPPILVKKARHFAAAGRLICPEIVVEAAVLLIDHYDMVDLFAQPLEVGRRRCRRPQRRPEARREKRGGPGRGDRFEKAATTLPENPHDFPWDDGRLPPKSAFRPLAVNCTSPDITI